MDWDALLPTHYDWHVVTVATPIIVYGKQTLVWDCGIQQHVCRCIQANGKSLFQVLPAFRPISKLHKFTDGQTLQLIDTTGRDAG